MSSDVEIFTVKLDGISSIRKTSNGVNKSFHNFHSIFNKPNKKSSMMQINTSTSGVLKIPLPTVNLPKCPKCSAKYEYDLNQQVKSFVCRCGNVKFVIIEG